MPSVFLGIREKSCPRIRGSFYHGKRKYACYFTYTYVKSFFSRKKLALQENIESQFYESWYHLKLVVSLQLQPGDAPSCRFDGGSTQASSLSQIVMSIFQKKQVKPCFTNYQPQTKYSCALSKIKEGKGKDQSK